MVPLEAKLNTTMFGSTLISILRTIIVPTKIIIDFDIANLSVSYHLLICSMIQYYIYLIKIQLFSKYTFFICYQISTNNCSNILSFCTPANLIYMKFPIFISSLKAFSGIIHIINGGAYIMPFEFP